jgi:hypothetical protein
MARKKQPFDWFELAKEAASPGACLLVLLGFYGAQKTFVKPYGDIDSILCLIAIATGFLLIAIGAVRDLRQ